MGDGTEQNPFTSKDVNAKIKERGGSDGLDFSGKIFCQVPVNILLLNTNYHTIRHELRPLAEVFKGKPHLEKLLERRNR
jgi:hypothetical protein